MIDCPADIRRTMCDNIPTRNSKWTIPRGQFGI
jgi:hypothetical protein